MNRCQICGKRYKDSDFGETECPRCKPLREIFGDKFGIVADWVLAISEESSEEAISRHLNQEEHP